MDNNNHDDIVRISDICVEINSEYTLSLKNVGHVLNIRLNMISTHILYKEGYDSLVFLLEWDHLCFSPTTHVKFCFLDLVGADSALTLCPVCFFNPKEEGRESKVQVIIIAWIRRAVC